MFSGDTSISWISSDKSRNNMGLKKKVGDSWVRSFLSLLLFSFLFRNEICLVDYYWKAAKERGGGWCAPVWPDGPFILFYFILFKKPSSYNSALRAVRFHLFILITMTNEIESRISRWRGIKRIKWWNPFVWSHFATPVRPSFKFKKSPHHYGLRVCNNTREGGASASCLNRPSWFLFYFFFFENKFKCETRR